MGYWYSEPEYHEEQAERERKADLLAELFVAAARAGDMAAEAEFAPKIHDWATSRTAMRKPTVGELLWNALDDAKFRDRTMALLCAVAYGSEPQVAAARQLLNEAGLAFGRDSADEVRL